MKIVPITENLIPKLEIFCNECSVLGYQNNVSLTAMKFHWCKEHGEFFCAVNDGKIIAVAGCHKFPEISPNGWRILFRGCELPFSDTFKGLGKGDWNSIAQREFIPKFIEYCPSNELYITTNVDHDHSNGKSARNHRLMGLLAKQGILDKVKDAVIYNTYQTVWKLNIDEYTRRRNRLRGKYVD
jgi:hypothetical protein